MQTALNDPQGRPEKSGTLRDFTPSPFTKKFRVRDLAYMAGIIDGEGCITGSRKTRWPQARVQVTNRSKELVDWCQQLFGGYTRECPRRNEAHARIYEWYCSAENIIPFLRQMVPFLKQKKRQAYLCMALRSGIIRQQGQEKLEHLVLELQKLNVKGMIKSE